MTVTPETLTDAMVGDLAVSVRSEAEHEERWWRDHQSLWTESGQHNHDLTMGRLRELAAICKSALNPQCHQARRDEARQRVCDAINARSRPRPESPTKITTPQPK